MTAGRWFRLYEEVVDDPKVQRLPAPVFKAWINLLCATSRNGGAIRRDDAPFILRVDPVTANSRVHDLIAGGVFEDHDGVLVPHNWNGRQFKSDSSAERMKRHRQRHRDVARNGAGDGGRNVTSDGAGNVTVASPVTPPEYRDRKAEAETEPPPLASLAASPAGAGDAPQAETAEIQGKSANAKRGSRLPDDFEPDVNDGLAQGLSLAETLREIDRFRDYWRGAPGRHGVKSDWPATWRNWCRKAVDDIKAGTRRTGNGVDALLEAAREMIDDIGEGGAREQPKLPGK